MSPSGGVGGQRGDPSGMELGPSSGLGKDPEMRPDSRDGGGGSSGTLARHPVPEEGEAWSLRPTG